MKEDMSTHVDGRGVQSIEIGGRLLHALTSHSKPLMLKEIASEAGIAPAQAHAYLVSYRHLGMVEKTESGNRYQLGPMALSLGIARMHSFDPMKLINKGSRRLADDTGLTVLVSVWGAFGPTVVAVHEGSAQIHMNTRVGTVYSMSGTATGRAFAAYLPKDLVQDMARLNKSKMMAGKFVGTIQSMTKSEMARIRQDGLISVDNPPVPGIQAIAAPVLDHLGQVEVVITLVGRESVLDRTITSPMCQALLECTQSLSSLLGNRSEHIEV